MTVNPSDKKPKFKSTPQVFVVQLENLNYGVDNDARMETRGILGGNKSTKEQIVELIVTDKTITKQELAKRIGLTEKGIENSIKQLKDAGVLKRVGTRGGYWEIIK